MMIEQIADYMARDAVLRPVVRGLGFDIAAPGLQRSEPLNDFIYELKNGGILWSSDAPADAIYRIKHTTPLSLPAHPRRRPQACAFEPYCGERALTWAAALSSDTVVAKGPSRHLPKRHGAWKYELVAGPWSVESRWLANSPSILLIARRVE